MNVGTKVVVCIAMLTVSFSAFGQNSIEEFDLFAKPTAISVPTIVPTVQAVATVATDAKSEKQNASAEEDERAIPITAIGLIFEADGSENSKIIIQKYFRLIQKYQFNPGRAFAIVDANTAAATLNDLQTVIEPIINEGIPLNPTLPEDPKLAEQFQQELAKAHIGTPQYMLRIAASLSVIPVPGVPTSYQHVKSFPTWMLYTKDGQILLEGIVDPSSMFTASGKFVEPLGVAEVK